MQFLQLDTIEAARRRIQQHLVPTPLIRLGGDGNSRHLAVKPEHLQPGGSFKIRGAVNSVLLLTDDQKSRGVVAYSTGNHAQAVGLAAKAASTIRRRYINDDSIKVRRQETAGGDDHRHLEALKTRSARSV